MRRTPWLLAGAALLASLGAGCINLTLAESRKGVPLETAQLADLAPGRTTLPEALRLFGAPLEVHYVATGRLLVWRRQGRNTLRFGLDASSLASVVDVTRTFSWILGLIHFTFETVHADEDRIALLFDRKGILRGIGVRERIADMGPF